MSSSRQMFKPYKINPVSFRYRMLSFNLTEKDDMICAEINTGIYPIKTQYNPVNSKGHTLIVKVDYTAVDRQAFKEPGLNLYFNLNSQNTWTAGISEDETGIQLEIHTGCYPMFIDTTNKLVTSLGNNISLTNNSILVKLVQPYNFE